MAGVSSNPWGLDESKYFTDVGGISQFLEFEGQLFAQQNQAYKESINAEKERRMKIQESDIQNENQFIEVLNEIVEMQKQFHSDSLEYENVLAITKYSDLLLSHSCQESTAFYQQISSFLRLILTHRDQLITTVKQAQRAQDGSLLLERRYQKPFLEILANLAKDLASCHTGNNSMESERLSYNASCDHAFAVMFKFINLNLIQLQFKCKGEVNGKLMSGLTKIDKVTEQCQLFQKYIEQLNQLEKVLAYMSHS